MTTYSPVWVILFPVAITSLAGCASLGPSVSAGSFTAPKENFKTTTALENNLGTVGQAVVGQNFLLAFDPAAESRLGRIGTRLSHYSERPNVSYRYNIVDSRLANAFSLPDGSIYMTRGALEALPQDEEIASLIAHELAHITHQHVVTAYKRRTSFGTLFTAALLGPWILQLISERGYTYQWEHEADVTALRYLIRAGHDPETYPRTLSRIGQYNASLDVEVDVSREMDYAHPDVDKRLKLMAEVIAKLRQEEKIRYDPAHFAAAESP